MYHEVLYSFKRCPFAIRARWTILKAQKRVIIREVDLKRKPKELLDISTKGTVPVLLTRQGEVIDESLDIMKWAIKDISESKVINPHDNEKRDKIQRLITQNDCEFKYHLDHYKYASRYQNEDSENHKYIARSILEGWDKQLQQNISGRDLWLVGNCETIADWALWPFVRQYLIADEMALKDTNFLTYIKKWLNSFTGSILYEKLMEKNKPWEPSDIPILFPSPK